MSEIEISYWIVSVAGLFHSVVDMEAIWRLTPGDISVKYGEDKTIGLAGWAVNPLIRKVDSSRTLHNQPNGSDEAILPMLL
ncbi:MAG: hypothetical protein GY866_19900 [Proteobacteria bacterium]|nr:hypothetical protein [Pseudomonadota bacterium]